MIKDWRKIVIFAPQLAFDNNLKQIKQLADGLFLLEYTGDYWFDNFLAQGGAKTNEELASFILKKQSENPCNSLIVQFQ